MDQQKSSNCLCWYLFTSPLCRSRIQVFVAPSVKIPELLSLRKRNLYNLKTNFYLHDKSRLCSETKKATKLYLPNCICIYIFFFNLETHNEKINYQLSFAVAVVIVLLLFFQLTFFFDFHIHLLGLILFRTMG